jgi:hypothetical protein
MKNYYKITQLLFVLFLLTVACNKKATDFRSFLGGQELIYPGIISNPSVFPGNGRILLTWHPNTDPSVTKYVVYWNNYADSVILKATSHASSDTVRCLINNLAEYAYTFFVYSYDSIGDKSISTEIDNARVYGAIYQGSLHNRLPDNSTPYVINNDGSVTLNFSTPDTINIVTNIKYTNAGGVISVKPILPSNNTITLTDYKFGTPVLYQSSYIPVNGSLDTFYTPQSDTFPSIYRLVQCDKSLFAETNQSSDMHPYESDTRVSVLWNGSVGPQGFPNIFHSDGAGALPGTISFDMGKLYTNLSTIEETGRNCCHNPIDFEVWGIADTTGAYPTLASNNAGWKAQSISKGWILLTEAVRTDDGQAAMKFNFISNPPPVRFIRLRVIKTTDDPNYVNMSQLTFWNKQ